MNTKLFTIIALCLFSSFAMAHSGGDGVNGGFTSGFTHPLFGWDHVIAMVAVGLWGAFLGRPAIWLLPVVFPVVMALGGALSVYSVHIPAVEVGIALSGIVLGAMVAIKAKPPIIIAAIIVGLFAIFHGHAHGTELPDNSNAIAYSIGFVIATGLLHLAGILFGFVTKWPYGEIAVRVAGGVIALIGAWFLYGALA